MAFYELEPWGCKVEDFRAASIQASITNVIQGLMNGIAKIWTGKPGRRKKYKPKDFMPQWGSKQKMTWQDMLAVVKQMNTKMGGKDLTRNR